MLHHSGRCFRNFNKLDRFFTLVVAITLLLVDLLKVLPLINNRQYFIVNMREKYLPLGQHC